MTAPGPPPGPPGPPGPPQQPSNGTGIASLVLGIISIPFCFCFGIGGLIGIAATVFGFQGKQKAEQGLATNRGMAMAGLILGIIGIGLGVIYWILFAIGNTIDVTDVGG